MSVLASVRSTVAGALSGSRLEGLRWRLDVRDRPRRRRVLQHERPLARRVRPDPVVVPDKAADAQDVAIAERLLAAHEACRRSAAQEAGPGGGGAEIWGAIAGRQRRFAALLEDGDPRRLAAYLCNVSRHDASIGITQGDAEYRRIMADGSYREHLALMAHDKLVCLGEAVGALAPENPEQGAFGQNMRLRPAEVVERIGERIGIDVTPPDVDGGLLKIDTGRGLFGERDANAIYTAHLLRQTVHELDAPRICEIGGGSGRVAYWGRRLGLNSYTVIDLPNVNVVQGYYALKSLPADAVSLYGEEAPGAATGKLQILPAHATAQLREPLFDLVLNQDSFPEMSAATVTDYLRWIRSCCRRSLLSINHESKPAYDDGLANVSVPELAGAVGGFDLLYRHPYWLRRGYVVELYRVAACP